MTILHSVSDLTWVIALYEVLVMEGFRDAVLTKRVWERTQKN